MAKEIFTAPWYPWYVRDVLTSERVELLSLAEEGGYRRALDRAWMIGSIPANPKDCATVIGNGCTPKIAEKVLTMFVEMPGRPDRRINEKLEKVREEQRKKYKKRSKAGKENAIKGWKQRTSANGNGIPTARHTDSDTEVDKKKEEVRVTPQAASTPKRGSRIPDTFLLTSEMREWASIKKPDVDLTLETEKFCNYWRSATGRNATKMDWILTWKNWILNARTNGSNTNNTYGRKQTDPDRLAESIAFYDNYPA
jgi:hypothetical protein